MSKAAKPFTTPQRTDSKTFQITLNPSCGLPDRVCAGWRRRSFHDLPEELTQYRNPKTKAAADAGVLSLINYMKKKLETDGGARRISVENVTVGTWIEKPAYYETA